MATAPTLLSIEAYLHTSYKPDVHFVDGEIEERNLGERTHAFIQGFILTLINQHSEIWGVEALVEQRIRVGSSRVRIADVIVLSNDAPFEEVTVTPPIACIEVLSPEDRLSRAELVLADYFAMGVPNIWLIDPVRRIAYTYDGAGLRSADIANLVVAGTPARIDLTPAFAQLDRKARRSL
jgi:Uma2 family endonuclease